MRFLCVVFALLSLTACSKYGTPAPSAPDYSGNWSSLQPHSAAQVGTGVLLTISGQTVTSATVVTEDYFGSAPQPGCLLVFTASGSSTFAGNSFVVPLSLASNAIAGISTLPLATASTFTGAVTLQGTFSSPTTATGQLIYTISSATCAGMTYTGISPTPGFGNQIRTFTASK